ncbi:MAG: capsular exopolysaccharide synthesis family protein, partial [Vicingaceae bacterium]
MQSTKKNNSSFQIDPKVLLSYAIKYWYLIFIGLLGGLIYAFYQVRYTPPAYSVNSRMLVKDEHSSWGQEYFLPGMELVSGRNRLINEIGVIRSFPLMQKVALKLNRKIHYYKIGNIKTTEMYPDADFKVEVLEGIGKGNFFIDFPNHGFFRIAETQEELSQMKAHSLDEPIETESATFKISVRNNGVFGEDLFHFNFMPVDALARVLQASIQIDVENQESSILILSHKGQTPEKSIDYLNALMSTYIEWGKNENNEIANNTIDFVDNQLKKIADSLVRTESYLENFQKSNFKERIYPADEGGNSNVEIVLVLEEQLSQRLIQKEYYLALINALEKEDFNSFPSSAVFGFSDPNLDQLIIALQSGIEEQRKKSFQLKENNGIIEQLESNINRSKSTLKVFAENGVKRLDKLLQQINIKIEKEEGRVLKIPHEQRKYLTLKRENKLLSDLYTFLLTKRSEAGIAEASNVAKAQILDFANTYRVVYVGPDASTIYTRGIFMGLALPLGLILIFYLLNTKIVDPTDLNRLTSIPILGSIMYKKGLENNILVSDSLKSITAEAFRNIRTKLNFMVVHKKCIKILVTSSISGEGKTFTSINLAAIYAASGKKTVIIGADMRKPKIFKDFGLKNDIGLSTFLINKGNLEAITQKTKVDDLYLISSGPIPPNPAELIESDSMKSLFFELEAHYEVIIIDSPPLGLVTDALLLKEYADASLYIVRHNYTKKGYLENINQLYEDKVMTNIGIVVNAVEQKSSMGYGKNYGY